MHTLADRRLAVHELNRKASVLLHLAIIKGKSGAHPKPTCGKTTVEAALLLRADARNGHVKLQVNSSEDVALCW